MFGILLLFIDLSAYKNYIIDSIPVPVGGGEKDLNGVCCCCGLSCNFGCSKGKEGILIYTSVGRIEGYVIIVFGFLITLISNVVDILSILLLCLEYLVVQVRMTLKLYTLAFKGNSIHGVTGMMRDCDFGLFPLTIVVPDSMVAIAEILWFICSIEFVWTHSKYAILNNRWTPKLNDGPLECLNCLNTCF